MKRGIFPALVLFFITPLIAEYLLGSLSFAQIGALPVMCLLYGGGAVLIRELARATKGGWPTIAILGASYAVIEEAFATQSLFNPHYLGLRLLDTGYFSTLGIGGNWTLYVLGLHVIWSVCVPIGLVEALFASRGASAWLGSTGKIIFGVLFVLGAAAVFAYSRKTEHFMASSTQFVVSGVVVGLLIWLGVSRRPKRISAPGPGTAPGVWAVGVFTFAMGSAFELTQTLQGDALAWWIPAAAMLMLEIAVVIVLLHWSSQIAWSPLHRYAAAAGGLLVYCWWGYGVEVRLHGSGALVGHTILVVFMLALIVFAAAAVRKDAKAA